MLSNVNVLMKLYTRSFKDQGGLYALSGMYKMEKKEAEYEG